MYRNAVVKGQFYPNNVKELKSFFEEARSDKKIKNPISVIIPHAGYIYSGKTAFKTLSSIDIPEKVLLMGPNHTGYGKRVAVYNAGFWETPFGDIGIDCDVANSLIDNEIFYKDYTAHLYEHSLEVITPMLKYLEPSVKIVPIVFSLLSYEECCEIADKITNLLLNIKGKMLIVVSSDMNHYEDSEKTLKKDNIAIEAIKKLDAKKLYENIVKYNITMCGFVPAIIAIEISRMLGATEGVLIEHTHSGITSGDDSQVVGYAGIIIK